MDPRRFELNAQALLAVPPDPELVHYVTDSDDLFSLSLAPLTKDIDWYARPQRLDPAKIGSWWLTYDSPANDVIASRYFYVHRSARTNGKWRPVEIGSDWLTRRIRGARELLRIIRGLRTSEVAQARQIISLALVDTSPHFAQVKRPVTLLVPKNDGMWRWLLGGGETMLRPDRSAELVRRMLDHGLLGHILPLNGAGSLIVKTAGGGQRELTWHAGGALMDGVAMELPGYPVASDWAYASDAWAFHVRDVLPSAWGSQVGHIPRRLVLLHLHPGACPRAPARH